MFFTAVSDYFLVLRDMDYTGYYIFFLAHAAYILRVSGDTRRSVKIMAAVVVCTAPLYFIIDRFIATAIVYGCFFIYNVAANMRAFGKKTCAIPKINRSIIMTGLILFLLCDVCIAFFNSYRYFKIPKETTDLAYPVFWFFYISSQFFLSVSGFDYAKLKKT